jgi:hypothetical protein
MPNKPDRHTKMEMLTTDQAETLVNELIELSKKQSEALKMATHFSRTSAETTLYDARCVRIEEISSILGKFNRRH